MLFSPRDYVIAPALPGYSLVQITKNAGHLTPDLVTEYGTWEEASRKARLLALMEGVHAWGREDDAHDYVELVMAHHQYAPWPEPWFTLDKETLARLRPSGPGLYMIGNGRPAFIGDTDNLAVRLNFHLKETGSCLSDVEPLLFSTRPLPDNADRHNLLKPLIRWWQPRCNSVG